LGEGGQFVQVLGEPRGPLGHVHETVLDHCGLRVHAHDFVALRAVAGDGVEAFGDQFLDELRAGGFVLDQHAPQSAHDRRSQRRPPSGQPLTARSRRIISYGWGTDGPLIGLFGRWYDPDDLAPRELNGMRCRFDGICERQPFSVKIQKHRAVDHRDQRIVASRFVERVLVIFSCGVDA
jgi:hypothetical protein